MKKALSVILICIGCISFTTYNPSDFQHLLTNKLIDYATNNYPEKIYVHTDKPYYVEGEDIWFSAYLVNGITHKKSNKSNVVYVELVDPNDSIMATRKLFTETVSAQGDFSLPTGLKQGKYLLRSYTKYMQNQDNAYFFKKEIPIFSFNESDSLNISMLSIDGLDSENEVVKNVQPDLGFYPEGGYLVNGITNKVAIKVKNQDLLDSNVLGYIETSKGEKITEFSTFERGLGTFLLHPEANETYTAVVVSEDEEITYELPKALQKGYVMNTVMDEENLLIDLKTNHEEGLRNSYLIGHQRGKLVFDRIQKRPVSNQLLKIPMNNLNAGILQITLFNENSQPVSERLVFIDKTESVQVSIQNNKKKVGVRDKLSIDVSVKNSFQKNVPSSFSVSVRDVNALSTLDNSENIKTWLLLNSDLRGKIESPGYFFKEGDFIKRKYLLDLTMLTHGWRRFSWQELLEKNSTPTYKPEKGLYINGITVSANAPYQQTKAETRLTFKRDGLYQEQLTTQENGYFSYGPFVYHDSINILIEASKEPFHPQMVIDHKQVGINLTRSSQSPKISRTGNIEFSLDKNYKIKSFDRLITQSKKMVENNYQFDKDREYLEEVFIKAKVKSEQEKVNAERNKRTRYFEPSHRVVVEDLGVTGARSFIELLYNIPGVRIGDLNNFNKISGDPPISIRGEFPSFYLNDRKVTFDLLLSINPNDIEFLDVLKPPNTLAYALEATSVVIVYTKKGSSLGTYSTEKKPGTISFNSKGFYTAREFYAPDYASGIINPERQDIRTTLHWEPSNRTETDQYSTVSFYTSDSTGRYCIEIEGITDTGDPFYNVSYFEVD